jgi:hypothetical protein
VLKVPCVLERPQNLVAKLKAVRIPSVLLRDVDFAESAPTLAVIVK